ncbi:MAG: ComEC/Rec2 family competence protein [Muribaculaceae bacterium]|nr:ComEC/Rec2 family competence protein [Muribaculaceae bacterium]
MKGSKTFLVPLLALLVAIGLERLGCSLITAVASLLAGCVIFFGAVNGRGKGFWGYIKGSALSRFENWPKYGKYIVFLLTLGASLILFHIQDRNRPVRDIPQPQGRLTATVEEVTTGEYGDRYMVRVENYKNSVNASISDDFAGAFRLMVYADAGDVKMGDVISFPDNIEWLDEKLFFRSDYDSFLESRGVVGTVRAGRNTIKKEGAEENEMREKLSRRIDEAGLSPTARVLVKMLLLGDRSDCTETLRQQFAFSGVAHVFALSGMHISIILGIILTLLMPLNLVVSSKIRYFVAILILWIYCYAVGFPVSTVRATIMASMMLAAIALERQSDSLNALFAAAFVILLINRSALADPAFQLSFFCVLCLISYSWLAEIIAGKQYGMGYKIASFFGAMIVATLGTWSIVAYHFGTFSLWFAITNTMILPLLPLYMIVSILYVLSAWVGFPLQLLRHLVELGSDGIVALTGALGTEGDVVYYTPGWVTVALFSIGTVGLGLACGAIIEARKNREANATAVAGVRRMRMLRYGALTSLALIIVAIITIPLCMEGERPGQLSVRRTLFTVTIRAYDGDGKRMELPLPERESAEWMFCGKRFVLVARNVYSSRARKQFEIPATPRPCDYLLIDDGYKGNMVDLLRHFEPETVLDCRRSEDGESFANELERLGMSRRYRVMRLSDDKVFLLTAPLENKSNRGDGKAPESILVHILAE